jgi:hypothetical protein
VPAAAVLVAASRAPLAALSWRPAVVAAVLVAASRVPLAALSWRPAVVAAAASVVAAASVAAAASAAVVVAAVALTRVGGPALVRGVVGVAAEVEPAVGCAEPAAVVV